VRTSARCLRSGDLDRDIIFTASIPVPQSIILHPDRHQELIELLRELAPLAAADEALYVTYSEAGDIWRTEYGSRPNVFLRDGIIHRLEAFAALPER